MALVALLERRSGRAVAALDAAGKGRRVDDTLRNTGGGGGPGRRWQRLRKILEESGVEEPPLL